MVVLFRSASTTTARAERSRPGQQLGDTISSARASPLLTEPSSTSEGSTSRPWRVTWAAVSIASEKAFAD
jgi:hypothetical protein